MVSKQLESIIATMPPATATKERNTTSIASNIIKKSQVTENVKIVATANTEIKNELKKTAKNMGITETVVILKALKAFGFHSIDDSMLVDKRTLR